MIKCNRCNQFTHIKFIEVHGVCEYCGLKAGTIYYDDITFSSMKELMEYKEKNNNII